MAWLVATRHMVATLITDLRIYPGNHQAHGRRPLESFHLTHDGARPVLFCSALFYSHNPNPNPNPLKSPTK
jgi:hypothetical protein